MFELRCLLRCSCTHRRAMYPRMTTRDHRHCNNTNHTPTRVHFRNVAVFCCIYRCCSERCKNRGWFCCRWQKRARDFSDGTIGVYRRCLCSRSRERMPSHGVVLRRATPSRISATRRKLCCQGTAQLLHATRFNPVLVFFSSFFSIFV